jgi:predicted GH43/DUF377 family glycosyl hydrolase
MAIFGHGSLTRIKHTLLGDSALFHSRETEEKPKREKIHSIFNPSIHSHEGYNILSYRALPEGAAGWSHGASLIVNTGDGLGIDDSIPLRGHSVPREYCEDIRLFTDGNGFLSAFYGDGDLVFKARVTGFGLEDKAAVVGPLINRPSFDGREKNFVPIDGTNDFVYLHYPVYCIVHCDGSITVREIDYKLQGIGEIRGGTPIKKIPGTEMSISFFHSREEADIPIYHCGWIIYDENIIPIGISEEPLMSGSHDYIEPCLFHGTKVVFPCGLIFNGDDIIVSLGVNDREACLLTIPSSVIRRFTKLI